ncbi:LOW QUALITY PROTEIN: tRNA wybutosine-synthesizing protein 5 [Spinachia spinachia]
MEQQEKIPVPIFKEVDKDVFLRDIYPKRRPAVLRGSCLGPCLEKWTVEYLGERGGDKEVKIHVSTQPQMDFLHKNFAYKTLPFKEFVKRASERKHSDFFMCENESYYLRSLGEDVRKEPADLSKQFPHLAEDFHIPQYFEPHQFFSSVFRISSCGLQLWTHYDVMDNLLAQVTGKKRVALYSPQDALHLYLSGKFLYEDTSLFDCSKSVVSTHYSSLKFNSNIDGELFIFLCVSWFIKIKYFILIPPSGDKSEVLDIECPDLNQFPEFVKAKRYECVLEPGDLLFIPALWFHNTLALQFGVGVNVFWRHLPPDSYDRKDPYGNKDPVAANRALQALEKALHALDQLPEDYRDFYGRRMVQRVRKRTYCNSPCSTITQDMLHSSQITEPRLGQREINQ